MRGMLEIDQGFPEWTELGQDSGLDPLGMQRPIEVIYQSLVPGISTITLRYRYYSFFPFILKHYEENIRHPNPDVFRSYQRRCEALLALICTYGEPELGITGSDWANRILNEAAAKADSEGVVDFTAAADPGSEESLRYLRNKSGAFGAIYATQMAEMGLLHFPGPGQPNPNPVCSELSLKLASAFRAEIGEKADDFFSAVNAGRIRLADLKSLESMKPSKLRLGSEEHALLTEILLGRTSSSNEADTMRRTTLQMLLKYTQDANLIPPVDHIKWHWYENVPAVPDSGGLVPQLWFLYQACDLLRVAYEAILSAALNLVEASPRKRRALDDLVDELVSFVAKAEDQTWGGFTTHLLAGDGMRSAREHANSMLAALDTGQTEAQVDEAVALIAILSARSTGAADLMEDALSSKDYFQSLRTETKFLDAGRSDPATRVIADLIRERILKRHLWVASRKFRKQKAYTFHIEPEDNLLRYRSRFRVSPSSPRLDQALRFLRDLSLIDSGGITALGRAELVSA